MSVPVLINFRFSVPRRSFDSFYWALIYKTVAFDPALIRDQVLIWEPALKWRNTVCLQVNVFLYSVYSNTAKVP